jgi:hypothetical protein
MVVLTQTCDIVSPKLERSYVEVCPLVELTAQMFTHVDGGTTTRYAIVPEVAGESLAADLDRVMTVKKSLVAEWNREQGCATDDDRIKFAQTLARKRNRFAFPTDFSDGMRKFRDHIFGKHGKLLSEAGKAYRELDEIRVRADPPNWNENEIELTFLFVISPDKDRANIATHIDELFKKIELPKKYKMSEPPYHLMTLDDLTARDYSESVPLDFEILSLG